MDNYKMRIVAFAAVISGAIVLAAIPQVKPVEHIHVNTIAPKPEDVSSIDNIVKASYQTISGGIGVPRQWGRDRSLYDPNVRFVSVDVDPKTKAVIARSMSHQDFVDHADSFMVKEGFEEHELKHVTRQFGNAATVLSSYEGSIASTGKIVTRGVNIFQLYFDGTRWWILSMVWDEERPDNPLPRDLSPDK